MNPKDPIYLRDSKQQKIVHVVTIVSAILATLTAGAVVYILWNRPPHIEGLVAGLAASWGDWPRIWFFYDYFWLYRAAAAPDSFDLFKHGQQTAIAIWAGISLALGGLASSDFVKPKRDGANMCPGG
jgi:hypothetical protein